MKPTILLVGKTGQVGFELSRRLPEIGNISAPDRVDLNLLNPDSIRQCIRQTNPRVIVNAAAYTAVDAAERDEATARAVNADAVGIMSCEAKKIGALVIHYSTDYVFDGSNKSPYEEADQPNPINVYGKTKLAGEEALRNSGATHLIFRTSWVYSTRRKNFLLTILGLATEKEELSIVADQIGSPTCAADIAAATSRILAQFLKAQQLNRVDDYIGTYHMTAAGQTSWHEFADTILAFAHSGRKYPPWFTEATGGHPLVTTRVAPISTHQFGSPTLRPSYSVLSNSRLTRTFGISLAHWRTQLDDCFSLQRSVL